MQQQGLEAVGVQVEQAGAGLHWPTEMRSVQLQPENGSNEPVLGCLLHFVPFLLCLCKYVIW